MIYEFKNIDSDVESDCDEGENDCSLCGDFAEFTCTVCWEPVCLSCIYEDSEEEQLICVGCSLSE